MTTYLDLPEFGLRFVPFEDPRFPALRDEIFAQGHTFPPPDIEELGSGAVLLNESGQGIVVLSTVWRGQDARGQMQGSSRTSNLGSSAQMEILTGRVRAESNPYMSILPGSKRLITERGWFGSNADVMPSMDGPRGGRMGVGGGFGIGRGGGDGREEPLAKELSLDFAVLSDGLCVGPDTDNLFTSLVESVERLRATSEEAAQAMRNGASEGHIFELLLPLARLGSRREHARGSQYPLLQMFGRMTMDQLVNNRSEDLLAWFDKFSTPSNFKLRRPESV